MSSRRKSTTPCMVLPSDVEQDPDMEDVQDKVEAVEGSAEGPAEALASTELDAEHEYSQADGEDSGGRGAPRRNNQTEDPVGDLAMDSGFVQMDTEDGEDPAVAAISLSKTPIMKMKSKFEPKRIAVSLKVADESDGVGESEGEQEPIEAPLGSLTPAELMSPLLHTETLKPGVLLNFPGSSGDQKQKSVLNSASLLPAGLAQVLSALQQAQQSQAQAQLLIPLSSIPSYNTAMDTNAILVNTYKKFPYPSVAEIVGLAAQTKFSEEQIKIWLSAQRLKHGVSWTPEEVEEARRKQFNGTVHTVPQTITVIPAHHLSAAANGLQSILQTCQIVGQPGLVFTQVGTPSSLPVSTPITLTVTGVPSQSQAPKACSSQISPGGSELKRATTVQPPSLTPQENSALSADHFGMRPKKSKEQLAELKASYLRNHFASDAEISRLMKLTNLTKGEIKKWFSDTRYNQRNSKNSPVIVFHDGARGGGANATIVIDSSDETPQSPPPPVKETRPKTWNPFPDFTLQKFKEKTPEQLVVLEESYQKCDTPSDDELSRLRTETKLTRREIDAWFTEKRKTLAPSAAAAATAAATAAAAAAAAAAESPELGAERMESEAACTSPSSSSSRKGSQTPPGARRGSRDKMGKKSPEQLHVLKSAFVRTQWPTAEDYDRLAEESGLPRPYIVNWFGDSRYSWKNGNLKWFFFYQSGNVEGGVNGNKNRKRRVRNRGWGRSRSRKAKRSTSVETSPPVKFKIGRDILKEYYLKHKYLNEQDLDDLVARSSMGYEQVREWFAEVHRREDMGTDLFVEATGSEEQGGEEGEEDERRRGEAEMTPEEQSGAAAEEEDDEEEEDDSDDSDTWEPSRGVRRSLSGPEDQ